MSARRKSFGWEGMASWVRQIEHLLAIERASSEHYVRFCAAARLLTVARIRVCRQPNALARVQQMIEDAVYRHPNLFGLERVWSKSERGKLLVEIGNRLTLLSMGRDRPKVPGPRFDIERIPDMALDRLIQTHRDLTLIDRLRAERRRRQSG